MKIPDNLNPREIGEMLAARPPLRNFEFASDVKRLREKGCSLKAVALLTGKSVKSVQAYVTAFNKAKRTQGKETPLPQEGLPRKWRFSYLKNNGDETVTKRVMKATKLEINLLCDRGAGIHFKGITFRKGRGWQAQIRIGKTVKYLGLFKTAKEAAEAYQKAWKHEKGF